MNEDRLDYYRSASVAYRAACVAYRAREIDDATYLAHREAWAESQREFDVEIGMTD